MELKWNQAELQKLADGPELERFVADLGEQVAARANTRAEKLFTDQGGGGVGSVESRTVHDERGVYAHVGYPPQFFYMNLHEIGTEHEKPRPHLRPALFGVRQATGGKDSAIRRIKQDKKTQRQTKRNRDAAKARRAV